MNGAERILQIMRQQGEVEKFPMLELGEMLTDSTCRAGGNELEKDDLMIAGHLIEEYDLTVSADISATIDSKASNIKVSGEKVRVKHTLKKGDTVLLYRISEDKYVIIEKVVSL